MCAATVIPTVESTRASSSIASAYARLSAPPPPYCSSYGMPIKPIPAAFSITSYGKRWSRSISSAIGFTSPSAKSRARRWIAVCSSVRSNMGRGAYPGARADLAVCSALVTHLSRRIYVRCTAVTQGRVACSCVLRTRTGIDRVDGSRVACRARVGRPSDGGARRRWSLVRVVPRALDPVLDAERLRAGGWRPGARVRGRRCRAAAPVRAEHRLRAGGGFVARRLPALPDGGLRPCPGRSGSGCRAIGHGRVRGRFHACVAARRRDVPAVLVLLPLLGHRPRPV